MPPRLHLAITLFIICGALICFYWTIGRHWLTARRTGQRLHWPVVTWLYDLMRADLTALENRVSQAQQRVDHNNCVNSAVSKTPDQPHSTPPLIQPQRHNLVDHRPLQRLPKHPKKPYDPSVN